MKSANLKLRVLLPLSLLGMVVLSAFIISSILEENSHIKNEFSRNLRYLQEFYQAALKERTQKLATTLEVVTRDPKFRAGLRTRNRQALLDAAQPLFKRLKERYNVTHFYFHDSHGVNLLRVHQPPRYGDTIKRFTMQAAARTGRVSSGIELGPLGTFTLRVVAPVREHNQLLGYIELGEEFENTLTEISSIYKLQLYASIEKKYLHKRDWQSGMRLFRRNADWDRFPASVIVFQNTKEFPAALKQFLTPANHSVKITGPVEVGWQGHKYRAGYIPLFDAGNRMVGRLLVMRDFTSQINGNYFSLFSISAGVLLLGGLLFGFLYFMLDQIERNLNVIWQPLQLNDKGFIQKQSTAKLLVILIVAIFVTDLLIMLTLSDNLPGRWTALIDASVLTVILYPLLYLILIHPYNRQIHLRQQAESGNQLLGRILDHSKNEIYMFDTTHLRFLEASQGACENLGYSREEMSHMTPLDLKDDFTMDQFRVLIDPLLNEKKQQLTFETRHRRKDGTHYPVEVHLEIFDKTSPPIFVAIIEDISERKHYIAELEHKALYDSLTELPNRSLLMDRLEHAIKVTHREAAPLSVLLIDVVRLQEINDIMGHADGDLVLQQVAKRLQAVLRDSDTIARIGGDEFVVVLPNTGYEHIAGVAKKILSAFEELIYIREMPLELDVAIGIAIYPDHGKAPASLLQHADVAMRVSKREASGFYIYTPADDPFSVRHLKLHAELRKAISEKTLALYYQPQLDIKTGKVTSVEALARWPHPEGVIVPKDFIPLVEQSGLIRPFTHWLLEEAINQYRHWQLLGIDLSISVNLSTRNLLDPALADHLNELIKSYAINPNHLTLEITESAVMNRAEKSLKLLTILSNMGFKLSIDDFGTGYSSLAYLKRMPVNELKIDQSFVSNMCSDPNDALIVRSTIELAHNMGLQVVAEGIEQQQQLDMLIQFGLDIGQGFFIAKPLPQDNLIAWFNSSPWNQDNTSAGYNR